MNKNLKSPFRSFGGKGGNGFKKVIYSLFPKHYEIFIEPFCGSAVIALNNPVEKCSEIINDLNQNIYTFYKVLQNKETFEQFKELLDLTCYHEDMFRDSQNALQKNTISDLYRAYHFFIVNRMSFSGNMGSFGKNYVIRRNMTKSTSDMLSAIDNMEIIHRRISQMIILNRDANKLIEENHQYDNTFMYLDPPYCHETRTSTRYPVDFEPEQQIELVKILTKPEVKAKFLLSGYDNELYDNILVKENNWNIFKFDVNTVSGSNKSKIKTECLWYNYELDN
jgi:DNA adenine methylase